MLSRPEVPQLRSQAADDSLAAEIACIPERGMRKLEIARPAHAVARANQRLVTREREVACFRELVVESRRAELLLEKCDRIPAVSYTHLDVYKRQEPT